MRMASLVYLDTGGRSDFRNLTIQETTVQFSRISILFSALICAAVPAASQARVYTVGADFACSHHDLRAALEAARQHPGRDEVRLARNTRHALGANVLGDDDVRVAGGFSSCSDDSALGQTRVHAVDVEALEWLAHRAESSGVRIDAPPTTAVASTGAARAQR
jgi:hypothetical protein